MLTHTHDNLSFTTVATIDFLHIEEAQKQALKSALVHGGWVTSCSAQHSTVSEFPAEI